MSEKTSDSLTIANEKQPDHFYSVDQIASVQSTPAGGKTIRQRKNKTSDAFQAVREKILNSEQALSQSGSANNSLYFSSTDLGDLAHVSPSRRNSASPIHGYDSIGRSSLRVPMYLQGDSAEFLDSYSFHSDDSKTSQSQTSSLKTDNRTNSKNSHIIIESELSDLAITDPTLFDHVTIGTNGHAQLDLDSLDPRISFLGTLSIFAERPDLLIKLRPVIQFKVYESGDFLQKQKSLINNLFWILDGNCTVSQQVSFIETLGGHGDWIVEPIFEDRLPIGPNEKLVLKTVESQNLDAGSWFPYFYGIEPTVPLTKEVLLANHKTHECECNVVADSRVIVAQISLEDFIGIASIPIIYTLNRRTSIYRFKQEFLREEYLAQCESDEKRSKFPMTTATSISIS